MNEPLSHTPPLWPGLPVQGALLLLYALLGGAALEFAISSPDLWQIYVGLGLFLLAALLLLMQAYRIYALLTARYLISASHLHIQWGLRSESIPLSELLWARPAERAGALAVPRMLWPGAVLGQVAHPQWRKVEFLASVRAPLVLVATAQQVFALSPARPARFLQDLQRALQMGNLTVQSHRSLQPWQTLRQSGERAGLMRLWNLTLGGVLALLLWQGWLLSQGSLVAAGFDLHGQPLPPLEVSRMLWMPVSSLFFALLDWLIGLLLYQQTEYRWLARFFWWLGFGQAWLHLLAFALLWRAA